MEHLLQLLSKLYLMYVWCKCGVMLMLFMSVPLQYYTYVLTATTKGKHDDLRSHTTIS